MTEEILIQQRMPAWRELEELTTKADVTFKRMSPDQILRFVKLYRQASGDLAFLSARPTNPDVVQYLNAVVARAYGLLYRAPRRAFDKVFVDGLRTAARTVRKNAWFVGLAFGIALFGGFAAYFLMGLSSDFREFFVPPGFESSFEMWKTGKHTARTGDESVGASFFYATNNPTVGLMTMASGLASFGLLTVVNMFQTGAMLGALLYETNSVGTAGFVLVSIFPHGVPEIGGIFITAASGFMLGYAVIKPGNRTRTRALVETGREAFVMLVTGLALIFFAAPIEGFFSFNPAVPDVLKLIVGSGLIIAFLTFFITFAREDVPTASDVRRTGKTYRHSEPTS